MTPTRPPDPFLDLKRKWGRPLTRSDAASLLEVGSPDDDGVSLAAIERLAAHAIEKAGLDVEGWTFRWDNAKVRAGRCSWGKKEITLSQHLMPIWPAYEVLDTVLHELAHAAAGPNSGHGWRWKRMCLLLGADPERCYESSLPQIEGAWTGTCPGGHTHTRHREPTRVVACSECDSTFRIENIIMWEHRDGYGPGEKYNAEWMSILLLNQNKKG